MSFDAKHGTQVKLRSQIWFDNPDDPDMTALYIERYMNWGLTREELQSGKPLIGIAQSGSDLSPCNRHHIVLAQRVREGIREAGGIAFEFPVHPIQETGKRPTASLDRNLAYLGLVETLFGYPIDGVVLTTGCDKTTPSQLMAAATVNIPAIALSVGPMLNGWYKGQRTGSGTIKWLAKKMKSAGEIDWPEYFELVASSAPSPGFCNTMGTATTMNSLAEALGMMLPGCAAIPAPHKERGQIAYLTGRRIVEMVKEDLKPSQIMTREAFENAIVVNSAIGGSTNAPIHLNAIAAHLGIALTNDDWEQDRPRDSAAPRPAAGRPLPRRGLSPRRRRAGGRGGADGGGHAAASGGAHRQRQDDGRELQGQAELGPRGDPHLRQADREGGGLPQPQGQPLRLRHHEDERDLEGVPRPLSLQSERPGRLRGHAPSSSTGARTITSASTIRRSASTRTAILIIRGTGPIGYPGGAEVVNMQPPDALLQRGINELPCIGDGRQSGTSGSPSILNASPEAAVGGGLALVKTGDRIRIDLNKRTANILISDEELAKRRAEVKAKLGNGGLSYVPHSQTPWQEIQRQIVDQFDHGMVLKPAVKYRDVAHQSIRATIIERTHSSERDMTERRIPLPRPPRARRHLRHAESLGHGHGEAARGSRLRGDRHVVARRWPGRWRGRRDGEVARDIAIATPSSSSRRAGCRSTAISRTATGTTPAEVAETIRQTIDAGVAGCSIEDSDRRRARSRSMTARMRSSASAAARAAIPKSGSDFVLTARCEAYLTGHDAPLGEGVERLGERRPAPMSSMPAACREAEDRARSSRRCRVPVNVLGGLGAVERLSCARWKSSA